MRRLYCYKPITTTLLDGNTAVVHNFATDPYLEISDAAAEKYEQISDLFYLDELPNEARADIYNSLAEMFANESNDLDYCKNQLKTDPKYKALSFNLKGNFPDKASLMKSIIKQLDEKKI